MSLVWNSKVVLVLNLVLVGQSKAPHCDKTRRAFKNTKEMQKTRAIGESYLRFSFALWYTGNVAKNNKTRFFYVLFNK